MKDFWSILKKIGSQNPDLEEDVREVLSFFHSFKTGASDKVKGKRLFSRKAYRNIRKALGKRTTPFFRFYRDLRKIYQSVEEPPEKGFRNKFKEVSKPVFSNLEKKETKNLFKNLARDAEKVFDKLDRFDDPTEENSRTRRLYSRLIKIFSEMILKMGRDQDIYLKKEKLKRPGWVRFELMTKKEEKMEKYKEMDPELYELEKKKNELREELNEKIEEDVRSAGYEPVEERVMGRNVITGEDKQASVKGNGKKRGPNVWKLNEEMASDINMEELTGDAIELDLQLGPNEEDIYTVKDYEVKNGEIYLKTYNDIDTKQWGKCSLEEKEKWVYAEDGNTYTMEEYKEKREEYLESVDQLSRVFPEKEELENLRTYGTKVMGKGRRGNVSGHDLGAKRWVLKDKDKDFDPTSIIDHPETVLLLHLNDEDYEIVDTGVQNKDGEEYRYVTVDEEITSKKYGQYSIQEGGNIVDRYKEEQDIENRALSDDSEKQSSLTRIYPTVEIHGETVIAEGRYKGIVLEDMINDSGRMIEGTAYDYDPETGRPTPLSSVENVDLEEPYISLNDNDELYLRIPSRNNYTEMRNKVRDLSDEVVEIDYIEGTRQSGYTFKPEHFRSVRRTTGSVAMSKAARDKIQAYFDRLAKEESDLSEENLENYSSDSMDNFKDFFDFHDKQKEALAWLDGEGGLIGADTGTGKTIIAVGWLQDLKRKGILEDENDQVIVIVPKKLRGNLESEIKSFCEDPEELLQHIDEHTYGESSWFDDENKLDQYEGAIFDEASALKNRTTKQSKIAQTENPRKLLLSASPMEKDPEDVYILAAIANNWDLNSSEGMKKRRKFEKRYAEKIGTKAVGVSQDPKAQEDLVDWMNKNVFNIDKREMEEVDLPSLEEKNVGISMPEEVEEEYRELSSEVEETMRRMVAMYRDKDEDAYDPEVTGAVVQLANLFEKLKELANNPEDVIEGVEENPKLSKSVDLIKEDIESNTRSLIWTDDPDYAVKTAKYLSRELPGRKHAYATSSEIGICRNGSVKETYTKRVYEDPDTGEDIPNDQWEQFVINTYIRPPDSGVLSLCLTQSYTQGYNLQEFSKVIHLDRDNWNAEKMKQRTARSWRQGQDNPVEEMNLDVTYSEPKDELDRTLDEIARYIQEMEEDLFEEFIKEMSERSPGKSWFGMKKEPAELYDTERDLVEMLASPYLENHSELKEKLKKKRS